MPDCFSIRYNGYAELNDLTPHFRPANPTCWRGFFMPVTFTLSTLPLSAITARAFHYVEDPRGYNSLGKLFDIEVRQNGQHTRYIDRGQSHKYLAPEKLLYWGRQAHKHRS